MDYPIAIPNHPNEHLVLRTAGLLRGARFLYNGRVVEKTDKAYRIVLPDSSTLTLSLKATGDLSAPKVILAGKEIVVIPALPVYQLVLAYLPMVMVFLGGAIGGLCGAGGYLGIIKVLRSKLPLAARLILSLAIVGASAVAYLLLAVLLQLAIHPKG